MREALEDAVSELKRVDHLYYVSLKYTRTVDMIRHVIERLISHYEFCILCILRQAKEQKIVSDIPENKALQRDLAMKTYPDNTFLHEQINMLTLFLKLRRAPYGKREEFRRHVTMISTLDNGQVIEVTIDLLGEYIKKAKELFRYCKNLQGIAE